MADNAAYKKSFLIERIARRDGCDICGGAFDAGAFYGSLYIHSRGIYAYKTCSACGNHAVAIAECRDEQRRMTTIGTGFNNPQWCHGDRCLCGAVTLESLNGQYCIRCSIRNRMLTTLQNEHKLMVLALRQLKKEIKTTNENDKNASN